MSRFAKHPLRFFLAAFVALSMAAGATAQGADPAWPSRPVKAVIPYGSGSSPDVFARIVGERLQQRLGQPVLVDAMPQVKAGKLRALAVSTARRSALMPGNPTMKEAGLPEIESRAWMAFMAPASTPTPIVERMNREINAVLAMPEVREKLHAQCMEPIGGSIGDLRRFMLKEREAMTPVIRRSGATIG